MTTPNMNLNCDGFADALADYLESDASDAVRAAVDAHAAGCAACASLLADLKGITASASALALLAPSRDLWSGIAERIDAPVIPMGASFRHVAHRTWVRPALAAAALVVITAGITHYATRASLTPAATKPGANVVAVKPSADSAPVVGEPTGEIHTTASEAPPTVASVRIESAMPKARLASRPVYAGEPVLDNEITKLRRIVNERRDQLDPRTIAVLEQSMAVIDSAIAQSRAALAKDPASGFLATQLNRSLEKKVELLRTATSLPVGT
jgi:hypothetical protein